MHAPRIAFPLSFLFNPRPVQVFESRDLWRGYALQACHRFFHTCTYAPSLGPCLRMDWYTVRWCLRSLIETRVPAGRPGAAGLGRAERVGRVALEFGEEQSDLRTVGAQQNMDVCRRDRDRDDHRVLAQGLVEDRPARSLTLGVGEANHGAFSNAQGVAPKAQMLGLGRRVAIVTRRMDAVLVVAEAAGVAREPCAVGAPLDVEPGYRVVRDSGTRRLVPGVGFRMWAQVRKPFLTVGLRAPNRC